MTGDLDEGLLIGSLVLLVAVAAVRLSTRAGLPSLLIYLALGVALGESGLGIDFENVDLTRVLGVCALVVIIAEGGLSARWSVVRPVLPAAATLATFGVVVSVAVVGVVVHLLLDVPLQLALLYGAVLSSTDAAAVFATLRRLLVRPRLAATLEAESGINDAPAVLLVLALSVPAGSHLVWWHELLIMLYELAAGGLVGVAVGVIGAFGLRRAALPAVGLYPLAVAGLTILAYALGASVHASGFLAVYTCGVILGNARLPHRQAVLGFADGLAWLAQIGLFVLLGLLASPARLPSAVVPALVVGTVLVIAARPLSVLLSVAWFRVGWREQMFLSWAGLRGAVPIVLATIPLSAGVPDATRLFDVVFVLVVIFTVLQATSLTPVARWLRVTAPAEPTELRVETAPLDEMNAEMLQLKVPPGSHLSGMYIDELRLPQGAAVTLVLREGRGFVPQPASRLRSGDSLLIVATSDSRDAAERRLRAVSRRGRLARWYGEKGEAELH
ncbi:potassium/proton antiporter [Luedemannella helvata]|uniref:Potassium/proton antiporter n=1 Tax=Luedemannella helvata TaxID=349315 RepID=A0ABP4W2H2_9ACTN